MDQIAIGKFIALRRRALDMTQRDLADRLGISDKTVSKWETGRGFPEVSLLMPLCTALEVTANELLSAQLLADSDYKEKAEENMMDLVKEAQESRKKMLLGAAVVALTLGAAFVMVLLAGLAALEDWTRVLIIVLAVAVVAGGVAVACVLDRDAGCFACPACGERFRPTMSAYVMGPHTLTKRRLKCPNCGKVSYCKHVLTK